jgi:hypothetical protein
MQRLALIASPLPHLNRTRPFRAACGNALSNRARLITLPLGNDAHHTACRYRLARQHAAEHRRAGVVHAFRHLCLYQLLRAHICDGDLLATPHETVRHHLEEMPTSSRTLRRTRPGIASRYRDGVLWSPAYFARQPAVLRWRSTRSMSSNRGSALPPRPRGRGFRTLKIW